MGSLIAMSGGVDSSVAAYLTLQTGERCVGATMQLYRNEDLGWEPTRTCCSLADVSDARAVAHRLGMPYYVFNFVEEFRTQVIDRFVRGYEAGETPNPCVDCNRFLKFGKLLHRARELELDRIVTGHYARISFDRSSGRWLLQKAADGKKDQTYFLYAMTQDHLAHTSFPLGGMTKAQVREIAEAQGFRNAKKQDSQDICFVPDGDYLAFLTRYRGRAYPEGDLLDLAGSVVGRHKGAVGYTLGQRRGLDVAMGTRVYVCAKCMEKNTVTLGPEESLYARAMLVDDVNWIALSELTGSVKAAVKARYRQTEQPAVLTLDDSGMVRVTFDEPQRAITPGQAAVFYDGETVLGGGTIRKVLAD